MNPEHRESLRTFNIDILGLEPRKLVQHLCDNGTISFSEKISINETAGRQNRAKKLMEILLNGGPHSFDGFIQGLNKSAHRSLATKLKTTADNIVNKTLEPLPVKKATTVSLVTGTFDKNSSLTKLKPVSSTIDPRKPLKPIEPRPKPEPEVEKEQKSEAVVEPEQSGSPIVDSAAEIYETLKTAHQQMKSHVDAFMPLLTRINPDGREKIQTVIVGRMGKVEEENKRLENSSPENKKKFNRDMIILVMNMNDVLTFMKEALLNLAQTLKQNESQYKRKIRNMEAQITELTSELDMKTEQLFELKREHMTSEMLYHNDMKKAIDTIRMATEKQNKYFEERDKREQEARQREARKQKEEEMERGRREREEEKRRRIREAEIREQERLKVELEMGKKREEEYLRRELELKALLYQISERERERDLDRDRKSSASSNPPLTPPSSNGVIINEKAPKLPVIGKTMSRTPRKTKY